MWLLYKTIIYHLTNIVVVSHRLTYDVNRMDDESHIIRTQTIDVSSVEWNIEHDHRNIRSHGNII